MRSASKNMCSVRHKPIPSAPKSRAAWASIGVSALVRTRSLRASSAQPIRIREIARQFGLQCGHRARHDLARRPIDGDGLAARDSAARNAESGWPRNRSRNRAGAGNTGPAHAARHHRGMARHATPARENTGGGVHPMNVLGAGLDADEDDPLARCGQRFGLV